MQKRRNSIALAMELRLFCINPSISYFKLHNWNIDELEYFYIFPAKSK